MFSFLSCWIESCSLAGSSLKWITCWLFLWCLWHWQNAGKRGYHSLPGNHCISFGIHSFWSDSCVAQASITWVYFWWLMSKRFIGSLSLLMGGHNSRGTDPFDWTCFWHYLFLPYQKTNFRGTHPTTYVVLWAPSLAVFLLAGFLIKLHQYLNEIPLRGTRI